jgi:hypothetical protein
MVQTGISGNAEEAEEIWTITIRVITKHINTLMNFWFRTQKIGYLIQNFGNLKKKKKAYR